MKTKAGIEKPLAEWTLKDVKEHCDGFSDRDCLECEFIRTGLYPICGNYIAGWDLTEKPKFTEQEVQDAKTIMRIFNCKGSDIYISRYSRGLVIEELCTRPFVPKDVEINSEAFPSIKNGERFSISEIVGDSDA